MANRELNRLKVVLAEKKFPNKQKPSPRSADASQKPRKKPKQQPKQLSKHKTPRPHRQNRASQNSQPTQKPSPRSADASQKPRRKPKQQPKKQPKQPKASKTTVHKHSA